MHRLVCRVLAASVLTLPVVALAGTATTTFSVTATVNANCAIVSASALSFPAYNPSQGAQNATSAVSVKCTKTTPFNIGLDAGTGTGATVTTRKMTSGSNTLNYSLYSDSNHSVVWGNTVGTNTVAGTGQGFSTTITDTVYGQIANQPDAVPGTYADTVTVTVSF